MKVGRLRSYWIIVRSVLTVVLYSTYTIIRTYTRTANRQVYDQLARGMSRKLLNIIQLSFKTHGLENLKLDPNRRYIIMSNHASHYDIPLSFITLPGGLRMITKIELFKIPIFGRALKLSEFIPIHRQSRKQAIQDLEVAKEKMESGIIIWIAPEGTRSRSGELQPFKKGGFILALQTEAIIIPVGLRGTYNILPPKTLNFHIKEQAEVYIEKPIDTKNYSIRTLPKLMTEVENSIRTALGKNVAEGKTT